jgi:hypothetical protein
MIFMVERCRKTQAGRKLLYFSSCSLLNKVVINKKIVYKTFMCIFDCNRFLRMSFRRKEECR